MRCFLCLELPDGISSRLHEVQNEAKKLGLNANFPKETHLTLCFYAEITAKQAQDTIQALRGGQLPKARLHVTGTGFFPSAEKPRVFWAGIENPELIALQKKVCETIDYREERAFSPHVTLARIKGTENVAQLRDLQKKHANDDFGEFVAEKLLFKQSVLSSEGATHTTLAEIALS
ncbi:MAG: RNA 2',3'-cyclic phosphodiesterase [Candidatus Micrarchaeota archaeon]